MNNPFDYVPDRECDMAFHRLLLRIEKLKESNDPDDLNFCKELEAGKMLGILIAEDASGNQHTLYAFSGQAGDAGFSYPGFVGAPFDYLDPDGYFKTEENKISRLNLEIKDFEAGPLDKIKSDFACAKKRVDSEIAFYKDKFKLSKLEREAKRREGVADEAELAAMVRQSQFEKAEMHRIRKRLALPLNPLETELSQAETYLNALKEKRRADSEALQKWLFDNFTLLNARGESKSLSSIFSETNMQIPPSGAGECCAPKLLQAAYLRRLRPLSIAEYWYGKPKDGEVRIHGNHYPACRGKCMPVLSWMLRGLDVNPPLDSDRMPTIIDEPEIIYENQWFCVINKPSGMLSVPGKGSAVSLQEWLEKRYGPDKGVKPAHRLDQDTSGLIVAAFGQLPFKVMQSLFATRKVKKRYVAELEGDYRLKEISQKGNIRLPLSPDWLDRPRQRVDPDTGKEAETDYEFIDSDQKRSRVAFYPHTGRTHQLRIHAASESGLGMPIVGDRLYGTNTGSMADRLHLHAHRLEFTFPIDGNFYCFESPVPF